MVHLILFASAFIAFSKINNKRLYKVSFFIIGAFAVLRYGLGNDYFSYMRCYESIRNGTNDPFKREIAFTLLNKLSPSFYLLVAVLAIFFVYVVYKLLKSNLDGIYKSLGFLIFVVNPYLFLMNLSAMRQSVASCLFIISLKYARERKFIKYLLLIALATLFHTSAIILLPIYLIANDKKVGRFQMIAFLVITIVLLSENSIVDMVITSVLDLLGNKQYEYYYSEGATNSLRATLLTGISFLYVLMNLKHLEGSQLLCGKLCLIGLLFGVLAYRVSMLTRLQMYFDIFSVVALPSIVEYHVSAKESSIAKIIHLYGFPILILIIYLLRYYSFFSNPMWESFGTYHTFFEALL